jgi:hypothetical protein
MKINNIEYIKLSDYNKLKKSKIKIVKEVKEVEKVVEKIKEFDSKEYNIHNPSRCVAICPLIKQDEILTDEIKTPFGYFKKIENPTITSSYNKRFEVEVIKINETKYGKDFIDDIRKMGMVWFSDEPIIYMTYNMEKKEFVKDCPVMFVFGERLCFILAPRIESE